MTKLYRYKDTLYEEPPINSYIILKEETINNIPTLTIKAKRPSPLNLLLILPLLGLLLFNLSIYNVKANQNFNHITKIPSEMFVDPETSTIDVDIQNDHQNIGAVNIKLVNNQTKQTILDIQGVEAGDSLGAIPIDELPEDLPLLCTLYYTVLPGKMKLKPIEKQILLINRDHSDKELNNYF